ncbi:MAG TPA: type II toxin-antitoxin system RelE/ParE family toxin [Ramlibacter sp.]|uniref:type II toxin-antitoxin system RelE/ParE family toxin n=1 Tax=Ramlibacter sp. TaxID=1917967 RepID=UPI002C7740AD|nr:type II toxin-antitoxin system RelE/ParE family toxin [Ramlibacter sp.]HVZ43203.1 type II toxin-antitoxin system RelE/ParE family toxin [Ramlibacter sp.]
MKQLRLESGARAELLHEVRYFETVRVGRGAKFRVAVDEVFARIVHSPKSGRPDEGDCRRLRVKGFPFSVVYREHAQEIVVFAIRPDARRPGYWVRRLE